jgi:hypothetical protein
MNPNYQEFKFPQIRASPWGSVFKAGTSVEAIELVGMMLAYIPERRCKALEVCFYFPFYSFYSIVWIKANVVV